MAIKIVSKRNGFRRCGVEHPDKPVIYPDDRFADEELEILRAEPMLVVSEVDDDFLPEGEGAGEPDEAGESGPGEGGPGEDGPGEGKPGEEK